MAQNVDYEREFSSKGFGEMVDSLNTVLNGMLVGENMGGQVVENIQLDGSTTGTKIPHNLKVTPKYRIILNKNGPVEVYDSISEWSDKYIVMVSSAPVTISILIMRG